MASRYVLTLLDPGLIMLAQLRAPLVLGGLGYLNRCQYRCLSAPEDSDAGPHECNGARTAWMLF